MPAEPKSSQKLRWLRLDNAAKIYPAARSNSWSSVFRLSATLTEPIDVALMQRALDVTVKRFPSIAARLRRGVFWYYLEQLPEAPKIRQESSCPVLTMHRGEVKRCALRVIVYGDRVAVEFFHSLTDGSGGLVFLKTLLAEYLEQRYGIQIPAQHGVLDRHEPPGEAELEDSFQRYAGSVNASRKETDAWRLTGTPEPDGFRNLICLQLSAAETIVAAKRHGVSITSYLCAAMLQALLEQQRALIPIRRLRKPVKLQIPVNLRRIFPSETLRNFALYAIPEVDPRLGEYSFDELCSLVHHSLGIAVIPQHMRARITANVKAERMLLVRILPLFVKNIAMKAAFNAVGERKFCLSMSNLGAVKLPDEMKEYVKRMDFILGTPYSTPVNCGVICWGDILCINFTRSIREAELESRFFRVLQADGLHVLAQSNGRRIQ